MNKYEKWYGALIEKRRKNPLIKDKSNPRYVYCETHHILPKCLGGTNTDDNLINLTAREHYVAHLLLVKIYQKKNDKNAVIRMSLALYSMQKLLNNCYRSFSFSSRLYEKLIIPSRTFTKEHIEKIKKAAKNRVISEETKKQALEKRMKTRELQRLNGTLKPAWNKGVPLSEETKRKMKATVALFNKNKGKKATTDSKINAVKSNLSHKYPMVDFSSFDFSYYISIPRHKIKNGQYLRRTFLVEFLLTQISKNDLEKIMTDYKSNHSSRKGMKNKKESIIRKSKTLIKRKYPEISFDNFNFDEYVSIGNKYARSLYLKKYVLAGI